MINDIGDVPGVRQYLQRIEARPTSLFRAVRRKLHGRYYRDEVSISFSRKGNIYVRSDDDDNSLWEPTDEEKERIKEGFEGIEFPTIVAIPRNQIVSFKPPIKGGLENSKEVYKFEDMDGDIVMMQVKMTDPKDKETKRYVPLTFWSDEEWRWVEPEGKLPLWGLHQLRIQGGREGGKSYRVPARGGQ